MNNFIGIKDLCKQNRYSGKHLQEELKKRNAPGSWDSIQNVYNLMHGTVAPKDAYVFIVLSDILFVDIKTILHRYSSVKEKKEKDNFNW
ncbi:MAG: hypothetical protein ACPGSG_06995 [Prolixibacteraceae bacterium]|jgi:hypothetical protein